MKTKLLLFLLIAPLVCFGSGKIKRYPLDSYVIHHIKVPFNDGVTTIMFPSILSGIYGANVATTPEQKGDFMLSYQPGQYYFTIRALKKNAKGSLNIVYQRKTYVITLEQSENAYNSVTFVKQATGSSINRISPNKLLACLDKAKAYDLFQKEYPDSLDGVTRVKAALETRYKDFIVKVKEVFRFTKYDTIVFNISFVNKTKNKIEYDPRLLAARLGNTIYYASLSSASGVMIPEVETSAYFAITGTPSGGRNNLAAYNAWDILVSTTGDEDNSLKGPAIRTAVNDYEITIKDTSAKIQMLKLLLDNKHLTKQDIVKLKKDILSLSVLLTKLQESANKPKIIPPVEPEDKVYSVLGEQLGEKPPIIQQLPPHPKESEHKTINR